tara:strand:- start:1254 stop:1841 length:588 start_codon:yes stop_codon:yes gene_type:complete
MNKMVVGSRVPRKYFITSGQGESNYSNSPGSFHLALNDAGIGGTNLVGYSSVLPADLGKVDLPGYIRHGSVLEGIFAIAHGRVGETVTAGIAYGGLHGDEGLVGSIAAEYGGNLDPGDAREFLVSSLREMHGGCYPDLRMGSWETITSSFRPKKPYGSAVVAIGFTEFEVPIIGDCDEEVLAKGLGALDLSSGKR